jgi:AcrR family transcriptional regulator
MSAASDPVVGLRARKKAAQRNAIYEIALSNFRTQGFNAATVQEIAAEANISLKTFFNYYPSKQSILDECVDQLLDGFTDIILTYKNNAGASFDQRLKALVSDMAVALESDPEFWLMIFTESKLFNASGSIKADELDIYDHVAAFFRSGQKSGELIAATDPLQLAEIFFSIYYFTALNWLGDWWPEKPGLSKRMGDAMEIFLNGIRAD